MFSKANKTQSSCSTILSATTNRKKVESEAQRQSKIWRGRLFSFVAQPEFSSQNQNPECLWRGANFFLFLSIPRKIRRGTNDESQSRWVIGSWGAFAGTLARSVDPGGTHSPVSRRDQIILVLLTWPQNRLSQRKVCVRTRTYHTEDTWPEATTKLRAFNVFLSGSASYCFCKKNNTRPAAFGRQRCVHTNEPWANILFQ